MYYSAPLLRDGKSQIEVKLPDDQTLQQTTRYNNPPLLVKKFQPIKLLHLIRGYNNQIRIDSLLAQATVIFLFPRFFRFEVIMIDIYY
jgi:hypothetical protein